MNTSRTLRPKQHILKNFSAWFVDRIPSKNIRFVILQKLSSTHPVYLLCRLAHVSLSGYYQHLKYKAKKQAKETKNLKPIQDISLASKRKYGYRTITMKLAQKGIHMNHKKVLRLMNKYHLLAKIRRQNPYKLIMKKTQEHRTVWNVLNRAFHGKAPFRKLWTDITYLRFRGKWIYCSIVRDMITAEILSFGISDNMSMLIIHITFSRLEQRCKEQELRWALFHSDQWFHYTHPYFQSQLCKMGCIQSMSRKWNCIDNSPTESFFGHMKDEIDLSMCESIHDVEKTIENYIFYHNHWRPQWSRKKMTPVEYRNHLLQLQP